MNTSILERIGSGDETAVEEFIDKYGSLIWSLAKRMSPTSADAEDATQEIFVEVWKKANTYDPARSSESTFVSLIARRRLIDRLRKMNNHGPVADLSGVALDVPDRVEHNAPETTDEANKALACLQKLSAEQQKVINLSVHHGVSHSKISELLKMPLGTVKSFARRALLQLRDCMKRRAPQSLGGIS